jgi:hypothetical protein
MHALEVITNACADALEKMEEGADWMPEYCSIVGPSTAIEMAQRIEGLQRMDQSVSEEEMRALGKLVRDLTGYIKLTAGDKHDPVRDDLLLQARQLLGVIGI